MTTAIEQELGNLEAAIAFIPRAVEPPPAEHDPSSRDDEADTAEA